MLHAPRLVLRCLPFIRLLACTGIMAALLAPAAAAAAVQCTATCEFYSTATKFKMAGFVEIVDVQLTLRGETYTQLAKYRRDVQSYENTMESAYYMLAGQCFDNAAASSGTLFLGTPYSPHMMDSAGDPATRDSACTQ